MLGVIVFGNPSTLRNSLDPDEKADKAFQDGLAKIGSVSGVQILHALPLASAAIIEVQIRIVDQFMKMLAENNIGQFTPSHPGPETFRGAIPGRTDP